MEQRLMTVAAALVLVRAWRLRKVKSPVRLPLLRMEAL